MRTAIAGFVADGFTHAAFGDLFLEDVRRYREDRLAGSGLEPLFPIWKTKPTRDLAHDMIEAGLKARLTCIYPRKLDRSFAGREFNLELLSDLPAGADPCGENGEFHSFAYGGPMFNGEISVKTGDVVDRDGFVFADLTLTEPVSPKS
jgi:diphthamide synthase (EF-2-diphthine--ammonia ligase)